MAKTTATQLAEFKKDIQYLTEITERGFKEIQKRQDITNGKVLRHEKEITVLQEHLDDNCNKFLTKEEFLNGKYASSRNHMKYLLTIIVGVVIAVTANFIIDKIL
jgi:F0F1-type ATP synthase assembly protein I